MDELVRDLQLVAGAGKVMHLLYLIKTVLLVCTVGFALAEAARLALKNRDAIRQRLAA